MGVGLRGRLVNAWLNPTHPRCSCVTEHDAAEGKTSASEQSTARDDVEQEPPASDPESTARDAVSEETSASDPESTACEAAGEGASEQPAGRDGRRFVLLLYAALVGVATAAGLLTGTFVDGLEAPRFLFLVPFPPTPLGFAAYGGLTLALVLGVPLSLVIYVSQTIDDG